MRFIGIIPARLASTRLHNKLLADICGKTMIQHVYERAKKCLDIVYVATDHADIFDVVNAFGGKVVMTPVICNTGTDRCYWAYKKIVKFEGWREYDVIINIQGDQPLLNKNHIYEVMNWFTIPIAPIPEVATVAFRQDEVNHLYAQYVPDKAFVVLDIHHNAMYFSRYTLPYCKIKNERYLYQHIGIYGFTVKALIDFFNMGQSSLEIAESLEQNRWLENGRKIRVGITAMSSMSVDTEEDLEKVRVVIEIENKMKGV